MSLVPRARLIVMIKCSENITVEAWVNIGDPSPVGGFLFACSKMKKHKYIGGR